MQYLATLNIANYHRNVKTNEKAQEIYTNIVVKKHVDAKTYSVVFNEDI